MFVVTLEFLLEEGAAESFRPMILENAARSVEDEPGCLQFDVCAAAEDERRIFLYEVYSDAEAFEAHKQMPHFKSFDGASAALVADKQIRILHRLS